MSLRRVAVSGLVIVAGGLLALARWLAPVAAPTHPGERPSVEERAPGDARAPLDPGGGRAVPAAALDEAALRGLDDAALAAQIREVVDSLDRTGRPPAGVAQGGRRGAKRGTFQNAEGRLPRRPPGYYTESDVWPRAAGGRGVLRLIVGRQSEVYFTSDHYRTFTRLR